MNTVTYGYGLRVRLRGSGPTSFGFDGFLKALLIMPAFSTEQILQGASAVASMENIKAMSSMQALSVKEDRAAGSQIASLTGISTERSPEGSKNASDMDVESVEQDVGVSSSEGTMAYHSGEGSMDAETVEPAVESED